jgi:hypothetical protein
MRRMSLRCTAATWRTTSIRPTQDGRYAPTLPLDYLMERCNLVP